MEKTDFLYADTNSRKLKITLIIFCLTWSKVGMAFKFTYFKNELINNANTNSGNIFFGGHGQKWVCPFRP